MELILIVKWTTDNTIFLFLLFNLYIISAFFYAATGKHRCAFYAQNFPLEPVSLPRQKTGSLFACGRICKSFGVFLLTIEMAWNMYPVYLARRTYSFGWKPSNAYPTQMFSNRSNLRNFLHLDLHLDLVLDINLAFQGMFAIMVNDNSSVVLHE